MGTSTIEYLVCDGVNNKGCGREIKTSKDGVLLSGSLYDGGPKKNGVARVALITGSPSGSAVDAALCTECLASLLPGLRAAPVTETPNAAIRSQLEAAEKRARDAETRIAIAEGQADALQSKLRHAEARLASAESRSNYSSPSYSYEETSFERRGGGPSGPQPPPELEETTTAETPRYLRVAANLCG